MRRASLIEDTFSITALQHIYWLYRYYLGREHRETLLVQSDLAWAYKHEGHHSEALEAYDSLPEIYTEFHGEHSLEACRKFQNKASFQAECGQWDEAYKSLKVAESHFHSLRHDDYCERRIIHYIKLSEMFSNKNLPRKAGYAAWRAVKVAEKQKAPEHLVVLADINNQKMNPTYFQQQTVPTISITGADSSHPLVPAVGEMIVPALPSESRSYSAPQIALDHDPSFFPSEPALNGTFPAHYVSQPYSGLLGTNQEVLTLTPTTAVPDNTFDNFEDRKVQDQDSDRSKASSYHGNTSHVSIE